jgi:hypothetical protein
VPVVRPTLRLLDDLAINCPPLTEDIGQIDHDVLTKARAMASSYPLNTIRINAVTDTLVYRFTAGRYRVCTWLEGDHDVLWLLVADLRTSETYDDWIRLHERHELLPSEHDYARWRYEADLRLAREIKGVAGLWLRDARDYRGRERCHRLGNGVEVFLISRRREDDVEELWLAMPQATVPSPAVGLAPKFRALLVAAMEAAAPGSIWEEGRRDYPARKLFGYEIACLGLAAA